jgi:hypothetical protein
MMEYPGKECVFTNIRFFRKERSWYRCSKCMLVFFYIIVFTTFFCVLGMNLLYGDIFVDNDNIRINTRISENMVIKY